MKKEIDVLIVGAGPTGLTLAAQLQKHQVSFRIIEQKTKPSTASKATNIQARTIELFSYMGIGQELITHGHQQTAGNIYLGNWRISRVNIQQLAIAHPYVLIVPQYSTEKILRTHLYQLGGSIEYGKRYLSFQKKGDLYEVQTSNADNQKEVIYAKYLISCEGHKSTIREQASISFNGLDYKDLFLLADVQLDCPYPKNESHVWFHKKGLFIVLPLPNSQGWRLFANISGQAFSKKSTPLDIPYFQELLDERTQHQAIRILETSWMSSFKISKRLASQYQKEGIFLVGDAAHIHNPLGGQGINTGIQDAYNLGWKLALVLQKNVSKQLLLTYEKERRPIAQKVLQTTHLKKHLTFSKNPLVRFFRDYIITKLVTIPFIQKALLKNSSQLYQNYRSSSLSQNHKVPFLSSTLKAGDRMPHVSFFDYKNNATTDIVQTIQQSPFLTLFILLPSSSNIDDLVEKIIFLDKKFKNILSLHLSIVELKNLKKYEEIMAYAKTISNELAQKLTIKQSTFLLLRPDGYIGFLGKKLCWSGLLSYLEKFNEIP